MSYKKQNAITATFTNIGKLNKLRGKNKMTYYIKDYIKDGFRHVCDVSIKPGTNCWLYTNINEELLYAKHYSWVYFITLNGQIQKVGESATPLGIKYTRPGNNVPLAESSTQPITGTTSRLGRYRSFSNDLTDAPIRDSLNPYIEKGDQVSFWAKQCEIFTITQTINGKKVKVSATFQKDMEMKYIDNFLKNCGSLPPLNKVKK